MSRNVLGATALIVALGACSHDSAGIQEKKSGGVKMVTSALGQVLPGKKKAATAPQDPNALAAAARYPERVAAAASFYGTWLVSDAEESPHLTLDQGDAERYIACAEIDELDPMPMVDELQELFEAAGSPGELEVYAGVHHGFAFPSRRIYDRDAAERHWERLIALYRRNLG